MHASEKYDEILSFALGWEPLSLFRVYRLHMLLISMFTAVFYLLALKCGGSFVGNYDMAGAGEMAHS